MKKIILFALFLLCSTPALLWGSALVSCASGDYNTLGIFATTCPSTGQKVPTLSDTVTISSIFAVTCGSGETCNAGTLTLAGTGSYTDSTNSTTIVDPGAGSGVAAGTTAITVPLNTTMTLNGTACAGFGASGCPAPGTMTPTSAALTKSIDVTGGTYTLAPTATFWSLGDYAVEKEGTAGGIKTLGTIKFLPNAVQYNFVYGNLGTGTIAQLDLGGGTGSSYALITTDQTQSVANNFILSIAGNPPINSNYITFSNNGSTAVYAIDVHTNVSAQHWSHTQFLGPGAPYLSIPAAADAIYDSITLNNTYRTGLFLADWLQTGPHTSGTRLFTNIVAYDATHIGTGVYVTINGDHLQCGKSPELGDSSLVECFHGVNVTLNILVSGCAANNNLIRNVFSVFYNGGTGSQAFVSCNNNNDFLENAVLFTKGEYSHPWGSTGSSSGTAILNTLSNTWIDNNWGILSTSNSGNGGIEVFADHMSTGVSAFDITSQYAGTNSYMLNHTNLYGTGVFHAGEALGTATQLTMFRGNLTYYPSGPANALGGIATGGVMFRQTLAPGLWDYNTSCGTVGVTGATCAVPTTTNGGSAQGLPDANGASSYVVPPYANYIATLSNMTRTGGTVNNPIFSGATFTQSHALGSQSATKVLAGDFLTNFTSTNLTWARIASVTNDTTLVLDTYTAPNWSTASAITTGWNISPAWVCNGDCSFSGSGNTLKYGADYGTHDFVADPQFRNPNANICDWYTKASGNSAPCTWAGAGTGGTSIYVAAGIHPTNTCASSCTTIIASSAAQWSGLNLAGGDWILICAGGGNCRSMPVQITGISGATATFTPSIGAVATTDYVFQVTDAVMLGRALIAYNGFDYQGNVLTPTQTASYAWATVPNALAYARNALTPMNGMYNNYYAVGDLWNNSSSYSNGQSVLRYCYWYASLDTSPTSGFDPATSPTHWQPTGGYGCNPGAAQAFNVAVMQ